MNPKSAPETASVRGEGGVRIEPSKVFQRGRDRKGMSQFAGKIGQL
jgi:hypothetical protein